MEKERDAKLKPGRYRLYAKTWDNLIEKKKGPGLVGTFEFEVIPATEKDKEDKK